MNKIIFCCKKLNFDLNKDNNMMKSLNIFVITKEDEEKQIIYKNQKAQGPQDKGFKWDGADLFDRNFNINREGTIVLELSVNEYQSYCVPIKYCPYCGKELKVEIEKNINYEYCGCGNQLTTDEEQRLKICRECK